MANPDKNPVLLTQRRVFILPTREGYLFALVLFMMLIGSINYANSLGFMLTFFLSSLSIVCILHTYKNLLHLKISVGFIKPVFSGEVVTLPVVIDNSGHAQRQAIGIGFTNQKYNQFKQQAIFYDIPANNWRSLHISRVAPARGLHRIGRFSLRSKFPLGIFTSWSNLRLPNTFLVYPAPKGSMQLPYEQSLQPKQTENAHITKSKDDNSEDFSGFRHYQPGDSLRHINWKAIAREQGVYTKQFSGQQSVELWLDWRTLPTLNSEARLSQLCRWVLLAETAGLSYGLWLPKNIINPSSGQTHHQQCLESLALYQT